MPNIFTKSTLIGLTVIGALTVNIGPVAAQSDIRVGVYVDPEGPPVVPVWDDGWGADELPPLDWGRQPEWDRPRYATPLPRSRSPRFNDRCSPEDALRRARDYGLRRPIIERVSSRWVFVAGVRDGDYDQVILKNTPGCPYTDH